jgi:hypothetical protein
VVVAKLDRAWRNVRDCAETIDRWRRRGIHAHLLDIGVDTNTPVGELVIGVMSAIAQWESRRIGERIREAKAVARAEGRAISLYAPFGWLHRRGKCIPDPVMRRAGALALARRRRGWLLRQIAIAFDAERVRRHPSAGAARWTAMSVWKLIKAAERHGWRHRLRVSRPPNPSAQAGYRRADGDLKRQARMKVTPERRREIARMGAAARRALSSRA